MLERTISRRIKSLSENFRGPLATGSRQVGKTTLLKMQKDFRCSYVTDSVQDRDMEFNDPEAFFMLYPIPGMIDEVRRAPGLFLRIKEIVDDTGMW